MVWKGDLLFSGQNSEPENNKCLFEKRPTDESIETNLKPTVFFVF